jgi:Ca2+-binding RTX toxin-like protein
LNRVLASIATKADDRTRHGVRQRARRQAVVFVFVAATLAFAPAPSARAATASLTKWEATYVAGAGEANSVTVLSENGRITFRDTGATITAGAGCTAVTANEVICRGARYDFLQPTIEARDLDDFASVEGFDSACYTRPRVAGGDGNDVLVGSELGDSLHGGAGNDTLWGRGTPWGDENTGCETFGPNDLFGGPGDDILQGGRRGDRLNGGAGADTLSGGGGGDTANYDGSTGPVVVTLDDRPGDGQAGEEDDVRSDVEGVEGTPFNDRLVGNAAANYLGGLGGRDLLVGRAGRDFLYGGRGNDDIRGGLADDWLQGSGGNDDIRGGLGDDRLEGFGGDDILFAGYGRDTIWGHSRFGGGAGNDTMAGGPGRDRVRGQDGNDVFYMRDGYRDEIHGGLGTDRARIDRSLDSTSGIELRF